jgi:hypothetical protein
MKPGAEVAPTSLLSHYWMPRHLDNHMKNIPFMGSIVKLVELLQSTHAKQSPGESRGCLRDRSKTLPCLLVPLLFGDLYGSEAHATTRYLQSEEYGVPRFSFLDDLLEVGG